MIASVAKLFEKLTAPRKQLGVRNVGCPLELASPHEGMRKQHHTTKILPLSYCLSQMFKIFRSHGHIRSEALGSERVSEQSLVSSFERRGSALINNKNRIRRM